MVVWENGVERATLLMDVAWVSDYNYKLHSSGSLLISFLLIELLSAIASFNYIGTLPPIVRLTCFQPFLICVESTTSTPA